MIEILVAIKMIAAGVEICQLWASIPDLGWMSCQDLSWLAIKLDKNPRSLKYYLNPSYAKKISRINTHCRLST